jgi:hypothetical protein
MQLLGVPTDAGWRMNAMLALGYPLGRWGVASNRRPVHEVASRNQWGTYFGATIAHPLWDVGNSTTPHTSQVNSSEQSAPSSGGAGVE